MEAVVSEVKNSNVLIVDDNHLVVSAVSSILKINDINTHLSYNGQEALHLLGEKPIDVIICDIMMPKMDGHEFFREIRSLKEYSSIPFIFLSALDTQDERISAFELGIDEYLTKPFNAEELVSLVKGKIKRSKELKRLSNDKFDTFRKRVIHTLSHEFRTPLVSINTGAELLLKFSDLDEKENIKSLIGAIKRGGERLEKLVNDFMLYQQIEAGITEKYYKNNLEAITVRSVFLDYYESFEKEMEELGFQCSLINTVDDSYLLICKNHILTIFERIVSNAVKFSEETKVIDVSVVNKGAEVIFSFRDYGIGIDINKISDAMEVFGQINRERYEQQGGGLGLAIAKKYAEINQGRIEFERHTSKGSIVSLILPCYELWEVNEHFRKK